MNTIVNKLLDVDKEARQMLDEAQQYYDRTLTEIQEEKQKMLDLYTEKADHHIRDLEAEEAAGVDEVVSETRARTAALLEAMEARYNEHHLQWEAELAQKCIGR